MSYKVCIALGEKSSGKSSEKSSELPERFATKAEAVWRGVQVFGERLDVRRVWHTEAREPVTHKYDVNTRQLEKI